jgi:Ca2+-binding RTX toxin-like protein
LAGTNQPGATSGAGGGGGGAGASSSTAGNTFALGSPNSPGNVILRYTDPCVSHAVVSVGNASVVEGNVGDTPVLKFPITVTNASACSGFNLQVETEDGTATAGSDYTALPLTPVNINPGETHIVVPVTVLGDNDVEQDETFRLRIVSATPTQLSDPADPANTAHLGDAVGTGTIIDDDDQIAECADNAPTPPGYNLILGSNGPDKLIGTKGPDLIRGFGGDDEILGGQGDDILCGGDGYDEILGGPGNDRISGGEGNDLLIGGSGQDQIVGDGGVNEIHQ